MKINADIKPVKGLQMSDNDIRAIVEILWRSSAQCFLLSKTDNSIGARYSLESNQAADLAREIEYSRPDLFEVKKV